MATGTMRPWRWLVVLLSIAGDIQTVVWWPETIEKLREFVGNRPVTATLLALTPVAAFSGLAVWAFWPQIRKRMAMTIRPEGSARAAGIPARAVWRRGSVLPPDPAVRLNAWRAELDRLTVRAGKLYEDNAGESPIKGLIDETNAAIARYLTPDRAHAVVTGFERYSRPAAVSRDGRPFEPYWTDVAARYGEWAANVRNSVKADHMRLDDPDASPPYTEAVPNERWATEDDVRRQHLRRMSAECYRLILAIHAHWSPPVGKAAREWHRNYWSITDAAGPPGKPDAFRLLQLERTADSPQAPLKHEALLREDLADLDARIKALP